MSDKASGGHPAIRRTLAIVVSVFVVLASVFASVGLWVQTSLFNSGAMAADARVFLADPAVSGKVGEFLTDTAVDIGKEVRDNSKDRNLGRVLSQSLTRKKIAPSADVIAVSGPVVETIAALVEQAHREILEILRGNAEPGTTVSLNLVPVVVSVLEEMQNEKIIPASVALPVLADENKPADDIAAFEKAFKVELKDDFGQLKIVSDRTGDGASTGGDNGGKDDGGNGMKFADIDGKLANASRALTAVFVLLVVLIMAVVFLAPSRKAGLRIASVAFLVSAMMASLIARVSPSQLVAQIDDAKNEKIVAAIVDSVISSYVTLTTIMLILAILMVLAAFWGQSVTQKLKSARAA